jgi:magnesium transporter
MDYTVDQCIEKINIYADVFDKSKPNRELLLFFDQVRELHPVDIAEVLEGINRKMLVYLFFQLLLDQQADVFMEFTNETRQYIFRSSSKQKRELLLDYLTISELVDFFDDLSDSEVNLYIQLVNKKERSKVLSLLEFPETSAAGIMEIDIIVLPPNMTVIKTIVILKKLKSNKRLYKTIYIVNEKRVMLGYIELETLVFADDQDYISNFILPVEYLVKATDDREMVAAYMTRYRVDIVPVIDSDNHFLGVITSEIIARTIEDEASEDIFRMASLSPIENTYFKTDIFKLFWQRASILTVLLLMQSVSTMIIGKYTILLSGFLITYIGIITSTGGNTSSQVSALVIQGLASGDIRTKDMIRFIKRECLIGGLLGIFISLIGSIRTYFFHYQALDMIIVGIALFCIVILSTLLGSSIPFLLHKLKLDPAYSAGPLLATCMDILGVILFTSVIFCIKYLFV